MSFKPQDPMWWAEQLAMQIPFIGQAGRFAQPLGRGQMPALDPLDSFGPRNPQKDQMDLDNLEKELNRLKREREQRIVEENKPKRPKPPKKEDPKKPKKPGAFKSNARASKGVIHWKAKPGHRVGVHYGPKKRYSKRKSRRRRSFRKK